MSTDFTDRDSAGSDLEKVRQELPYAFQIQITLEAQQAELATRKPAAPSGKAQQRPKQAIQRELEQRKWRAQYDILMLETSLEFRLGRLVRKHAPSADRRGVVELAAILGNPDHPSREKILAELDSIFKDEAILQSLLPLLDAPPSF